jgi:hypothetical protein
VLSALTSHNPGDGGQFRQPVASNPENWIPMPLLDNCVLIDDLRFAIDVMDEYSHLGLDSEYALKLRTLMQRQIAKAEEALNCRSALHAFRDNESATE